MLNLLLNAILIKRRGLNCLSSSIIRTTWIDWGLWCVVAVRNWCGLVVQSRHDERYDVSNHRRLACLLNRLFRRRSKKTSKFRITGLCEGKQSVNGWFPSQRVSSTENVSIWWSHHGLCVMGLTAQVKRAAAGNWAPRGRLWWRHQKETFSALLAFCALNAPASDAVLPTVEQTMETPMIWDAIALIITSLQWRGSKCVRKHHASTWRSIRKVFNNF